MAKRKLSDYELLCQLIDGTAPVSKCYSILHIPTAKFLTRIINRFDENEDKYFSLQVPLVFDSEAAANTFIELSTCLACPFKKLNLRSEFSASWCFSDENSSILVTWQDLYQEFMASTDISSEIVADRLAALSFKQLHKRFTAAAKPYFRVPIRNLNDTTIKDTISSFGEEGLSAYVYIPLECLTVTPFVNSHRFTEPFISQLLALQHKVSPDVLKQIAKAYWE